MSRMLEVPGPVSTPAPACFPGPTSSIGTERLLHVSDLTGSLKQAQPQELQDQQPLALRQTIDLCIHVVTSGRFLLVDQ